MSVLYLLETFLLCLVLVPVFKKISVRYGFVDRPNARKMHKKPKPVLGGAAVFLSIIIAYLNYTDFSLNNNEKLFIVLSLILVLVGIFDDRLDLKAWHKLILQMIVSFITALALGGIQSIEIYEFTYNFNTIVGYILEMIWFVILINAFNLIDGLDGLATGTAIISFTTLLIMAIISNDISNIPIILMIIGALLGFLFYNFYPSTIFLGDSGSMFIGYMVAILSINDYKTVTLTSSLLLFLIVFLPILDTVLSFLRRKVNGEKVFKADALHFHHRLLKKGYSHPAAVLLMYGFMISYSAVGLTISLSTEHYIYKLISAIILIVMTIYIVEKFYLLSDYYAYFTKTIRYIKRKVKK